jgi:hypothetical protein
LTAEQALLEFLEGCLAAKRRRVLDLARRPKARAKFLELLHHQLGDLFREACVVDQLPDAAWVTPALRFKPPREFGLPVTSLRAAYTDGGQNELVITVDGRYGYWRDEVIVDSERLVIVGPMDPRRSLR